MGNVRSADLADLKKAARVVLTLSDAEIDEWLTAGLFVEVDCG
ncbi:hypothetical protein [Acidisphaera sp. S103]|nr:hypothetical protein [Acidisphaera sp. S103]